MDFEIIHGEALEVMRGMADNSVDAVVTDPPYFKVKGEAWDHQWDKPAQFIEWMGQLAEQWQRILKPNGSLYVFASPKMAWHVEGAVRERFAVLMNIRWQKPPFSTKAEMFRKSDLRNYFPASETIIFAEHYGADNIAKGEAGYAAKCDELRGFVFEPLRAYLDGERERSGFTPRQVNEATGTQMAGHWFTRVQWALPTAKHYATMRDLFNAQGGDYLRREYEDLRREYEDLRREYEDLRRPFNVTAEDQYTDVWTFPTVQAYQGKHVCEKPLAMMEHIIKASTRPGAIVLDCFAGSAATGHACLLNGRKFIGIELSKQWTDRGRFRLAAVRPHGNTDPVACPRLAAQGQISLFA
ncbi:MAG: site-specific DNA-methyltransferase [Desulfurellales bacterium]|nr:MAG: site-specific DNA-methyltransferase [Desulfurellales bacterium]